MLWARRPFQTTRQQCRHPSSFLGLHEILDRGLLRDESLVNRIKRSRLALQLAVALQQLYMGPWLQRNWRAEVVRFLYQEDTHTIDRLDQPFISCQLLQDWTRNTTIFDEAYRQVDDCPQFFLHFAQLLVDIAKGERDINLDTDVALPNWYTALDEHITLNFQNGLLKSYGKAIRGCLHYSVEYNLAKTRLRDPKLRAKTVINEHIVRHLRRNLKMWEEVRDREDHVLALPRSGDSYEKLPPGNRETHGHNTVAQCHIIDPQVHKRPLDDAEFVLFADDDALYEPE